MFINILYEGDYEDCDIICVPDFVGNDIEEYGQRFCHWLASDCLPDEYYVFLDGRKCINLETEGFVSWLNTYFCSKEGSDLAYIVKQHTDFVPKYPVVEF